MKSILFLVGCLLMAGLQAVAEDIGGLRDACAAGAILDANHIWNEVIEVGNKAGCLYDVDGTRYIYSPSGSARLNPARLARVTIRRISPSEASRYADGSREIRNGCLVFAACAFAQCRSNAQVIWAGIITAQLLQVPADGEGSADVTGHALVAYEDSEHQIFIQENGDRARRVRQLTRLAQKGDRSWYDPSMLLLYSRQGDLGTADFAGQFGQVR
jgi:hypothetical protein